jgi:hypothetical protein
MSQRDPEYDRFGPWVIGISDEDPAPPLFVPHMSRTETPLLAVKIPRKIARRDAHPGMNLYDIVVSLYGDDMVVLERVDDQVKARTILYRDVQHLRVREELLRGVVHLGIAEQPYDLPYNTVSSDVMRRLVAIVRERYQGRREPMPVTSKNVEMGELSFYFERLLRDEQEGGSGMRPVAAQADTALGALEEGRSRRILFGLVAKRLLESLHLCDGLELKVIDRGQPYAYRWQSIYGRSETWIPLDNITAADWDWGEGETGPVTVTVRTPAGRNSWAFTPNNPTIDGYREFLATAAGVDRPR